jgi:hypothetical protein
MQKNLEEKQQAMRQRVQKRPKKKRVVHVVHHVWTPGWDFRTRRRIVARFFLLKGWTTNQVAVHFGVEHEMVQRWIDFGMPICGDRPVKPLLETI